MNKKIMSVSAACALAASALTFSAFAQTTPTPTPAPGTPGTPGMHRHHTAIRAAIVSLQRAEAEMRAAAHDYGGHRVEALAACDTAINQLTLALQYADSKTPQTTGAPASSSSP